MTKQRYFHFSLGPVQEFVGKARRLRDYWTGSYLLSYLTEQAMDEVCRHGNIVFPPYKINNKLTENNPSYEIGSFPNRFQANVPMDFEPTCCEKRVKDTWKKIADYVWTKYIAKVAPLGKNTKEIWERQVEGFWYMQWVLADEEDDALLDKRKNWRSHIPTVEHGDKCTLFGNLQEISGYIRSSKKGEGKKQKEFWEEMRLRLDILDLKEGERLSAIALIKRLFPQAYNDLKGTTTIPENFPSTTYMSSISWKKEVVNKEEKLAIAFLKEAKKLKKSSSEAKAGIQALDKIAGENKELKGFISLDGNCFYSHTLLNDNLWEDSTRTVRENLERKLININKKVGFEPDTYYALLSMDGDKIGAVLKEYKCKKEQISKKISAFSESVPGIIKKHNGRVIYAGGEDVFAILPVDTAIDAAVELRNKYTELFELVFNSKEIATISAAIIFAHHHAPLNKVYTEIQSLLDNKAKDEYGRASLAIGIWNTGGPHLSWAMPWRKFINDTEGNLLSELAKTFGKTDEAVSISNSFIYKIKRDFSLFANDSFLNSEEILDLITAEYIRSRAKSNKELTKNQVRPHMEKLLKICSIYYRDDKGVIEKQKDFNIDGALLVKFLARRWHR